MESQLTLHGYSHASDEAPTLDESAKPCKARSLHLSLLSLEERSCSHNSSPANKAPLADGASLAQNLQPLCQVSQCNDEASMQATAYQRTLLNKKFVIPIQVGWTVEGNMMGEYFGLAMAVCAVGLIRSACLGSEATSTKFFKQGALSMLGKSAMAPLEILMQRSSAEAEVQGKETQAASGRVEKFTLLQKVDRLQEELSEVKRLRSEDGKANERVVSIFASKEQAWNVEKRKFRNDQQMLCQELQRAYFHQEAVNLKLEQLRSLQKRPCSVCEHRESLFAELKDRLGEQEFLIMATMEEAQVEQQEKNILAEKLDSAEISLSQMEKRIFLEAEKHAIELQKHKESVEQLQISLKEVEIEHSQVLQDLRAAQARLSTFVHEKCFSEEHAEKMSTEISQLKQLIQRKDDIVSAMLKKAKADSDDRKELERELAVMKAKLCQERKPRQHLELSISSSTKTESLRFRNSSEARSVLTTKDLIQEMQKLHDIEITNLQSTYEEQVQMLQRRLNLYQERVADLEEDILLHMSHANRMITNKEHDNLSHEGNFDNNYMAVLKESLEAELVTKQFQLSVAKTLIKQFMDLEAYREQEVANWKTLYLQSKMDIVSHKEKEQAGAIVPKNSEMADRVELGKTRYTYKLEQRQWQLIDAFERQMKARDERMEAFRWQLLHMQDEMQRSHRQLEALKQNLANASEENRRLKELMQQQKNKVLGCLDKLP